MSAPPTWALARDTPVIERLLPRGVEKWLNSEKGFGFLRTAQNHFHPKPTYIFVTPRHWPQKDEWANARKAEGPWRDVRVYDADDLVHWIEQTPAVGLWLASRLRKRRSSASDIL